MTSDCESEAAAGTGREDGGDSRRQDGGEVAPPRNHGEHIRQLSQNITNKFGNRLHIFS